MPSKCECGREYKNDTADKIGFVAFTIFLISIGYILENSAVHIVQSEYQWLFFNAVPYAGVAAGFIFLVYLIGGYLEG